MKGQVSVCTRGIAVPLSSSKGIQMEEEKFEGHRNGEMRKNNKISLDWSYETTSWNCWAKKWMFQWFSEEMRADDTGVDTSRHVGIKTAD